MSLQGVGTREDDDDDSLMVDPLGAMHQLLPAIGLNHLCQELRVSFTSPFGNEKCVCGVGAVELCAHLSQGERGAWCELCVC